MHFYSRIRGERERERESKVKKSRRQLPQGAKYRLKADMNFQPLQLKR